MGVLPFAVTLDSVAIHCLLAGLLALWKPRPYVSIEEGPADRTLFYEEGLVSTVKVLQRAGDARQRVMLTGAIVNGYFVIRICVVSHRTHMDRMQMCLEDIRAAVAELRA